MGNPIILVIVVILVIALLGGLGGGTYIHNWGYGYGAGHYGVGGIGGDPSHRPDTGVT